jgi:ketosteroid isomerase-like protein
MKHMTWIPALLAAVALRGLAADATPGREADHQELRALRETVAGAMDALDTKTLASCLARTFVLTMVDQTCVTNAAQIDAFYDRIFRADDAPLAKMQVKPVADDLTRFVGPDAGYCYGSSVETYTMKNGRAFTMTNRWTAVVVKEEGAWKIAALHSGINFMDNPVLAARSMSCWRRLGVWLGLCKAPWDRAD